MFQCTVCKNSCLVRFLAQYVGHCEHCLVLRSVCVAIDKQSSSYWSLFYSSVLVVLDNTACDRKVWPLSVLLYQSVSVCCVVVRRCSFVCCSNGVKWLFRRMPYIYCRKVQCNSVKHAFIARCQCVLHAPSYLPHCSDACDVQFCQNMFEAWQFFITSLASTVR